MNAKIERGTVNKLLTLFTPEGVSTCKATLLLTPMAFSPGVSEGMGTLRPLVGLKEAVGQGVLQCSTLVFLLTCPLGNYVSSFTWQMYFLVAKKNHQLTSLTVSLKFQYLCLLTLCLA